MGDNETTAPIGKDDDEITVVTEALKSKKAGAGPPCLVTFYGDNIGRRHSLDKQEHIIGRADTANLSIDHNSVSRQHAKITVHGEKSRIFDLGSTNGTFVNDERIDSVDLRDGDLIRIGTQIFKFLSADNIEAKYHEEIYRLTTIDGLTQAYNKRYFEETIEREVNRAQRYGRVLSLVIFDIDHFKKVNDTHGHLAGDFILRELALLVAGNLRREDVFSRYGGEEFTIILPEINARGAQRVCEKQRKLVANHYFGFDDKQIPITISLGISTLTKGAEEIDAMGFVAAADEKLYEAKQGGRNRVCV